MNSVPTPQDQPNRKRIGELAVDEGLVTHARVDDALKLQKELGKLGLDEKLGQIFVKKKWISSQALDMLLRVQGGESRRLGNYEILEKIGQGGMGAVFRARQISMDRIVALKILAPAFANNPSFIERFAREARAAGQFCHENIVTAVDAGFEKPYHYLVMDYVEGKTLLKLLKERGPLPENEAVTYTLHVARALKHALEKKVIHRDVKPDNVMVDRQGKAKLLDLGLACIVDAQSGSGDDLKKREKAKHSTGHKAVGTPHYISPEAASGQPDIDTRADIYSLGCSLYHMLTGSTPFKGKGRQVMTAHLTDTVPDLKQKRNDCSEKVARAVAKMTAKDRNLRYPSPTELIEDLEALLAGKELIHAVPVGRNGRTPPALTTGPRTPIGARGTTGPRAAIRPARTTGPAAPISGPRANRSLSGPTPFPKTYGNGKIASLAALAAVLIMIVLGMVMLSRTSSTEKDFAQKTTLQKKIPNIPSPGETSDAQKTRPVALQPDRQRAGTDGPTDEAMRTDFEALKAHQKNQPEGFDELLPRFELLVGAATDTPLAREIGQAHGKLKESWQALFDRELKDRAAQAGEATKASKFSEALRLLEPEAIPTHLRALDWRALLDAERAKILTNIQTEAEHRLGKAQETARSGTLDGLRAALEELEGVRGLPSELSATDRKVAEQRKSCEQLLQVMVEKEAARKVALLASARQRLEVLREKLDPMLRAGKLAQARELLIEIAADPQWSPVSAALQAERIEVEAVIGLKREALDQLAKRLGEQVEIHSGSAVWKGKISRSDTDGCVDIKIAGGATLSLHPEQLEGQDVERFLALPQAPPADRLKALGLLFLYSGDAKKARTYFSKAGAADLAGGVETYLRRAAVLEQGELEVQAAEAWKGLQPLITGRQWKDLVRALEDFSASFSATAFAKQRANEIDGVLQMAKEKELFGHLPTQGLQMRMAFNEGRGDKALGSRDGKLVGQLIGGPVWTVGRSGTGLLFDAKDDFVEVGINVSETSFCVALWLKTRDPQCGIFSVRTGKGEALGHDRHLHLVGGQLRTRVWRNEILTSPQANLADGNWHHVVLQFGPEVNGSQIFVDGKLAVSGKKANSDFGWQTTIRIGYSDDAATPSFNGLLDEVLIYERTLKPEEIAALAQTSSSGQAPAAGSGSAKPPPASK